MNKVIYIAGGCFWGVEMYYKKLKGVINTEVGYANGDISDKFQEVSEEMSRLSIIRQHTQKL